MSRDRAARLALYTSQLMTIGATLYAGLALRSVEIAAVVFGVISITAGLYAFSIQIRERRDFEHRIDAARDVLRVTLEMLTAWELRKGVETALTMLEENPEDHNGEYTA